jgi:hypothetical protein
MFYGEKAGIKESLCDDASTEATLSSNIPPLRNAIFGLYREGNKLKTLLAQISIAIISGHI